MRNLTAWLWLFAAGLTDVFWAYSMKKNDGFSQLGWSAVSLITVAAFIWMLSRAMQTIPMGTAYAVWGGIGTIGTLIVGALFLHEPVDAVRIACIVLILGGIIGLKLQAV